MAAWSALGNAFAGVRALRGVLHERVTDGAAPRILAEQEVLAQALADALADVPDAALRMPGGEEEWNVAQTFAHATAARRFLPTWAAMAAADRQPKKLSAEERKELAAKCRKAMNAGVKAYQTGRGAEATTSCSERGAGTACSAGRAAT